MENIGSENVLYLGELQKLSLKPDDVLVLTCPGNVSLDAAERIKVAMRKIITNKVIVLGNGIQVEVLECAPSA